jgi:hypothetical protein
MPTTDDLATGGTDKQGPARPPRGAPWNCGRRRTAAAIRGLGPRVMIMRLRGW